MLAAPEHMTALLEMKKKIKMEMKVKNKNRPEERFLFIDQQVKYR